LIPPVPPHPAGGPASTPPSPALAVDNVNTKRLRDAVTVAGILGHERILQRIANQNGATRASGTPGFDASADDVAGRLQAAGYSVSQQEFTFPFYKELAPAELEQVSPTPQVHDTGTYDFSGSGEVTGVVVPTNDIVIPPTDEPSSTSGCEDADFTPRPRRRAGGRAHPARHLHLRGQGQQRHRGRLRRGDHLQRGQPGADRAVQRWPAAWSCGSRPSPRSTRTGPPATSSPTPLPATPTGWWSSAPISTRWSPGRASTTTAAAPRPSSRSPRRWPSSASGTARRSASRSGGAEESGLLGSEHYVESLSNEELQDIVADLNFDMLGSPNYVRFVYDGDGSATGTVGPPGSAQIEALFNDYFASQGLATEPTEFDGRSDYGPFIDVGIPAGGLFSGAEGIKTAEEAAVYGGTAGEPYDSCYHQACDDITNLSTKALFELGDGAAHAVMTLARTRTGFFEDGSFRARARTGAAAKRLPFSGSQAAA
jgi:hypothetical protein